MSRGAMSQLMNVTSENFAHPLTPRGTHFAFGQFA